MLASLNRYRARGPLKENVPLCKNPLGLNSNVVLPVIQYNLSVSYLGLKELVNFAVYAGHMANRVNPEPLF